MYSFNVVLELQIYMFLFFNNCNWPIHASTTNTLIHLIENFLESVFSVLKKNFQPFF